MDIFTNQQTSDHILLIGIVGISVFITVLYDSILYGSIFLASVLFVVSFNTRNNNNDSSNSFGKVEAELKDTTASISKVVTSKIRLSTTSTTTSTTTPSSAAVTTPTKQNLPTTTATTRTPPPPPPQSTKPSNIINTPTASPIKLTTPPTPPPQSTKPSNVINTPTPSPTLSSTNTTPSSSPITIKPSNIVSSPSQSPISTPPPIKVVTTKSEAILEKGKRIGDKIKLIPQIPNAITDIKKEFKETKDKKNISTLRGIIGGAIKNIATPSNEDKEKEKKRKMIAQEILTTEKVYVGKLKAIVDVYLTPLKVAATENPHPPLTSDQIHSIFSEILIIYNYNSHFYTKLDERMKENQTSLILGDLFLSITDFLKSYSVYVNNFTKAMSTLEKARKNPNFELLLQTFQQNPACDSLDINSLLIMPVQRVPRYILLLNELIKNTDAKNADFENLNKALEKMKVLASVINENKRDAEFLNKMLDIQNCLEGFNRGDFINPSRRLILDSEFNEKVFKLNSYTSGQSKLSSCPRRWLLCTDILVRCKVKGKRLIVQETFNVNEIQFKEIPGEKLSIISTNQSDIIVLKSLIDENHEEKWLETINNCKKVYTSNLISFEKRLSSSFEPVSSNI